MRGRDIESDGNHTHRDAHAKPDAPCRRQRCAKARARRRCLSDKEHRSALHQDRLISVIESGAGAFSIHVYGGDIGKSARRAVAKNGGISEFSDGYVPRPG
jgi:hypothetical protein